jgi:hypothetical protein
MRVSDRKIQRDIAPQSELEVIAFETVAFMIAKATTKYFRDSSIEQLRQGDTETLLFLDAIIKSGNSDIDRLTPSELVIVAHEVAKILKSEDDYAKALNEAFHDFEIGINGDELIGDISLPEEIDSYGRQRCTIDLVWSSRAQN